MTARKIRDFTVFLAVTYSVIVAGTYVFQRKLIYPGSFGVSNPAAAGIPGLQVIAVTAADGQTLHGWFVPPPSADKPVIIFFHGNAGRLEYRADWAKEKIAAGYGVFLAGYRGYDGETGSPSEQGLYADARAQIKWLAEQGYSGRRLVIQAESIGTGVAVQMATEFPCGALVLEAPYADLVEVGRYHYPFLPVQWLLKDRFESVNKIASIHAPLLIVQGTADDIVPISSGQRLYAAAEPPKEAHWIEGAGHNLGGISRDITAAFLARIYAAPQ